MEVKYIEDNREHPASIDRHPDLCPICNFNVDPIRKFVHKVKGKGELQITFLCPKQDCNNLFIAYYSIEGMKTDVRYKLKRTNPKKIIERNFENEINELSSGFVKVYNEAKAAEQHELHNIAGMGYRKALEFLIKDFLIFNYPEKETEIKKKMLGSCIQTYITNERIRQIAERASWLGNDEVHYEKRWIDKDVEDLKKLIEITLHYISMERQADKYINEMRK
ncbi:hypothetical protein [Aeribacillus composti]|jgi:hypothetical protein